MNKELEAFADEMRQAALSVYGATGGKGRAADLALAMADRAQSVCQGERMKAEQSAGDAFDLATLKVNLNAEDPSEPNEARMQE